jgi:molybdate transport system ATP-binding protein
MIEIDFDLKQGSFAMSFAVRIEARTTAIFGPSGAGKTTILDVVAGLRHASRGRIIVGDRVLLDSARGVDLAPHQRHVGYVPQDVALFPHMNVRRNLLYGRHSAVSPDLSRVVEMLEIDALPERRVSALSGGERQRVALGRALMSGPSLLLLDEPLAAVDVPLRRRILPYLERVRDALRIPIVYVSHDRDEVRELADHVLLIESGRLVASGSPAAVL